MAVQVTRDGGYEAFESPDGSRLYYIKSRKLDELWSVPPKGGDERFVTSGIPESRWAVTRDGVLFAVEKEIRRFDFANEEIEIVQRLRRVAQYGFTASEDGGLLAWSQVDLHAADLWAAELR